VDTHLGRYGAFMDRVILHQRPCPPLRLAARDAGCKTGTSGHRTGVQAISGSEGKSWRPIPSSIPRLVRTGCSDCGGRRIQSVWAAASLT
jgi:hypothetical protein